jgi:hypothetical protein
LTAKTNHFRAIAFFLLKAFVFLLLTFVLVQRLQKVDFESFNAKDLEPVYLLLAFLFIPFNHYFEWLKWRDILERLGIYQSQKAMASFASGMVSAFLTPAFSGNFLGRVLYFSSRWRWKLTIHSLVANFSQFLTTFSFGAVSLLLLKLSGVYPFSNQQLGLALTISLLACLTYFFGERLAQKIRWQRLQSMSLIVRRGPSRGKHLIYSTLRYMIYAFQFSMALKGFGVASGWELYAWVSLVYLVVTLTPSLFFGKVVVRESIAVSIMGLAGYAPVPVFFASLFIWIINLLLPSFLAAFFVRRMKIDA